MRFIESFFDQAHQGEFSLLHFAISASAPPESFSFNHLDPELRLKEWMRGTSYFHECRHYHDLVGTTCGFHTMLQVSRLVDLFLHECLTNARGILHVPLRKHAPFSPLVLLYDQYQMLLRTILGDFPPEPVKKEAQGVELRRVSSIEVPFFVLTDFDHATFAYRDRAVPIGLRALLEASALEMQIYLTVGGASSRDVVDHQEIRDRGDRYLSLWSHLIRSGFILPYGICHFYFHYATRKYPPVAVLQAFADAAMMYSGFSEAVYPGESPTYDHPGMTFVTMVNLFAAKGSDEGSLVDMLENTGRLIGDLPLYRALIQQMAERLDSDPASVIPKGYRPQDAKTGTIATIRDFLLRDHTAILKDRAEDPEAWLHGPEYLKRFNQLPMPPLVQVEGAFTFHRPRAEMAQWILWIFLLALVEDLVENGRIQCPIFFRLRALGSHFSFEDPAKKGAQTDCTPFMEKNLCGAYDGRFKPGQPPTCPFALTIDRVLKAFPFEDMVFPSEDEP